MTPHRAWFETYEPYAVPIKVANGTVVKSAGIGSVRFLPRLQGVKCREVVFQRVLHVPQLQSSLLSVLYLASKQGVKVVIDKHTMSFFHSGNLIFTATQAQSGRLSFLDGTTLCNENALSASSLSPQLLDYVICLLSITKPIGYIGD